MDHVIIVSGDGHAGAQPAGYQPYLDPEYREFMSQLVAENEKFLSLTTISKDMDPAILDVVDFEGAIRSGGEEGAWDGKRRLAELDREGVAAEVIHAGTQMSIQPFFSVANNPFPADVRAAGGRAFHRWLADVMADADGRMVGVADPGPCLDLDETLRELRWAAEHGFRSVAAPGNTADPALSPIGDRYYDPFWALCADHGLVVSAHVGYGSPQGKFWEFAEQFTKNTVGRDPSQVKSIMMEALASAEDSPLAVDMGPRRLLWQLMTGGVFDRFPSLHFVLTEVRADWMPATLGALDARYERGGTSLTMAPSEYWHRNGYTTPSSIHLSEMAIRHEIGVDNLMFGTDYPHPEATWPNTLEWIKITFEGVPEDEARKILGENAIECYGLDRAKLAAVAERIGPKASDVLLDHYDADPARIQQYNARAGLSRPAEAVDVALVESLFEEDLAGAGAR